MQKASIHNKKYRHSHPERANAHSKVNRALRDGKMFRMACEKCGSAKTEAHHDDYSKPLEVRWLCTPCHKDVHKKLYENSVSRQASIERQLRQNEYRKQQRKIAAMNREPAKTKRNSLREQAIAMRLQGMSFKQIGEILGMSKGHAFKAVKNPSYK